MKQVEIGELIRIHLPKQNYMVHTRGNPALEALLIQKLRDEGHKQGEIGKMLRLSQAKVSKRLRLLTLAEPVFKQLLSGKLRPSVAYELTKLEKGQQVKLRNPTLKSVGVEVRRQVLSREESKRLSTILEQPLGNQPLTKNQVTCPKCGFAF